MGPGGHHHHHLAHIQMHNQHQGYSSPQISDQQNFILHPQQIPGYSDNPDNCTTTNNNSGDEDEDDDDDDETNGTQMPNVFNSKEYQSLRNSGYPLGINNQGPAHHQALLSQHTYTPEDLINTGPNQLIYGTSSFNNQQRIIQQQQNLNISIQDANNGSSTTSPSHHAVAAAYSYYSPNHVQANYHPSLRSQLQFYQGGQNNQLQHQQQHSANHLASHSQSSIYQNQMMSAPHLQFNEIPAINQILTSSQQTWQSSNR